MNAESSSRNVHRAVPPLALAAMLVALAFPPAGVGSALYVAALMAAVGSSVHHAEVIAHRVGEPYGTLVLALAVTVIETALIVSLMMLGGDDRSALVRDAVFAVVMIVVNGVVGICLLVGGLRHRVQAFRVESASPALAAIAALATLTLVLPVFTVTEPGPYYSTSQLWFAALASLGMWIAFVLFQTVHHREYFLPRTPRKPRGAPEAEVEPLPPPSLRDAWTSFALLLAALVAVVGLAKALSPALQGGLDAAGAPPAVMGIVVSMIVLLPETVAAVRAAYANRLQSSMNLALGSVLATIGLTIPAVVVIAQALDLPLRLGLAEKDIVLLVLTLLVAGFTLGRGHTTRMQGAVHLVVFAAWLFLAFVP